MCRFVAKKAGLAGTTEEEEIYAYIILELVMQVCGKEGWPGGRRRPMLLSEILELDVQIFGEEGWPSRQDGG